MRIRFFTDKDAAADAYNLQAASGIKAILMGPDDSVIVPAADGKPFVFDPEGTGNVFVLVTGAAGAIANFDVPKKDAPKAGQ